MEVALNRNSSNKHIKIFSITEILLQSPMLNMVIVDFKVINHDANALEQHSKLIYMYNIHFYLYSFIYLITYLRLKFFFLNYG